MIVHTVRIPYKYGETIRIRPIGDVHLGSTNCDERAAKSFINDAPEGCYYVGIGDLMDMIIASDTKRYSPSQVSDQGDDIVDKQILRMQGWLEPVKDRILGLGLGNHETNITMRCGTNPIKRLCDSLDVKFLGYSWILKVILHENNSRGRTVLVRGHHGFGGGSRTQGADLTKYSKDMAHWSADVFLYGHVHRKQTDEVPRLGLVGEKLVSKPKMLGICGSFLKTYSNDENPSYSELKGYPPVTVGGITLCIKPSDDWVKMWFE